MSPADARLDEAQMRIAIGRGILPVDRRQQALDLYRSDAERFEDLAEAIADLQKLSRTDLEALRKEAKMASLNPDAPARSSAPSVSEPGRPVQSRSESRGRWALLLLLLLLGGGALVLWMSDSSSDPSPEGRETVAARPETSGKSSSEALKLDQEPVRSTSAATQPPATGPKVPERAVGNPSSSTPSGPRGRWVRTPGSSRSTSQRSGSNVRAPASVASSPRRLRNWLETVPKSTFRELVGTPELDDYVATVVNDLQGAPSEEGSSGGGSGSRGPSSSAASPSGGGEEGGGSSPSAAPSPDRSVTDFLNRINQRVQESSDPEDTPETPESTDLIELFRHTLK
ncbi:MAG: hypothetical protein QF752_07840 [Planctomycetota bacterium]|nr:hypothetical protein [Planctomycetota bacterium]